MDFKITNNQKLLFKALELIDENWQEREDDNYINLLAYCIKNIFGSRKHIRTILRNLRSMRVESYRVELQKFVTLTKSEIKQIDNLRMKKDRKIAIVKRYKIKR